MQQEEENASQVPYMQRLYDRPILWLVAGFVTMLVFYTLWGIYEIISLPPSDLP